MSEPKLEELPPSLTLPSIKGGGDSPSPTGEGLISKAR